MKKSIIKYIKWKNIYLNILNIKINIINQK
uniref:Uncharacterized protein n=1 Tax=viral metagenome TaxID=1070528 RepID=A0A6C0EBR5_9ZZZZ